MAKQATKKKPKRPTSGSTIAAKVVADLERRTGRNVSPADLVREAQNKSHPLHHRFIWDDAVAGHKHRLATAAAIISSIRVVTKVGKLRYSSVCYVRDPQLPADVSGYVAVARLRTERENAEDVILHEVGQVVAHLERAREIANVLDMVEEFEAAWNAAQRLQSRIRKGPAKARAEVTTEMRV